ncbi:hypothetical protein HHI36_001847 [Cryptolaemus montrouzieri]|uniref:ER-bound oxygenase mpaB/mpaB'/Rubber oxygenase catalytic domain-containing protein n=1 Tax=Cryptolaemus montrouzieri TaxID=559131 RepID=A0ABD2P8S6_9CUCU
MKRNALSSDKKCCEFEPRKEDNRLNYKNEEAKNKTGDFSAEEFVNNLLNEASEVPCDETINKFDENIIPKFYDNEKFKRAQEFFKANIFALYFSKLLGLIVILASPSVLTILQMTGMSGCIMSSYRRYLATLLHMNIWYESELSPKSRSMESIKKIKYMHNTASKKAKSMGMAPITQKDMVLTQFGFMGFAIARSEMVGIHNASETDLQNLIHFWKVIGYILGIEDRFNLCRDSLEETKQICEVLIHKAFRPSYQKKDKEFLEMTSYLVQGMWHFNPFLHQRVFLTYLYEILKPKNNDIDENQNRNINEKYFELNLNETLYFKFVSFVLFTLKYNIVRLYLNFQLVTSLWIMDHFPYLAVYNFGYRNAMVSV